ncbi:MAG: universal stress protein [Vicinamibacterales bacterium]
MIALKKVLVPTDFSVPSERALRYAREFARKFGAQLQLLHVVEDLPTRMSYVEAGMGVAVAGEWQQEIEADARARLQAILTADDRRDLQPVADVLADNDTAAAIREHAARSGADLIVMGATGRSRVNRFFMGSVADKVIRTAPCPVLIVHHPEHEFVTTDAPTVG